VRLLPRRQRAVSVAGRSAQRALVDAATALAASGPARPSGRQARRAGIRVTVAGREVVLTRHRAGDLAALAGQPAG